jgi:hypothetical protein
MRHLVIGGEFIITKNFFLRGGYNYQHRKELKVPEKRGMTGFSFGFGFRVYKFHFSYARAVYHLAGASNNFSISFNLNSFAKKRFNSPASSPETTVPTPTKEPTTAPAPTPETVPESVPESSPN